MLAVGDVLQCHRERFTIKNQTNKQTKFNTQFFYRCFSTYLTVKYNMQILRRCRQCEKHIKTIFYYTQEDYINFQFHTKKKHLPHCGTFVSPSPIHRPVWLINSLSLSRSLSLSLPLSSVACVSYLPSQRYFIKLQPRTTD